MQEYWGIFHHFFNAYFDSFSSMKLSILLLVVLIINKKNVYKINTALDTVWSFSKTFFDIKFMLCLLYSFLLMYLHITQMYIYFYGVTFNVTRQEIKTIPCASIFFFLFTLEIKIFFLGLQP